MLININCLFSLAVVCVFHNTRSAPVTSDNNILNIVESKMANIKEQFTSKIAELENKANSVKQQLSQTAADIKKTSYFALYATINTEQTLQKIERDTCNTTKKIQERLLSTSSDTMEALKKKLSIDLYELDNLKMCAADNGVENFDIIVTDVAKKEINERFEHMEQIFDRIKRNLTDIIVVTKSIPEGVAECMINVQTGTVNIAKETGVYNCIGEILHAAANRTRSIEKMLIFDSQQALETMIKLKYELPETVRNLIKQIKEQLKKSGINTNSCGFV